METEWGKHLAAWSALALVIVGAVCAMALYRIFKLLRWLRKREWKDQNTPTR
jgi:hypothetical protein